MGGRPGTKFNVHEDYLLKKKAGAFHKSKNIKRMRQKNEDDWSCIDYLFPSTAM